jgi:stearoyl-CoA desaturase (delta-9 desaturase)
MVSLWVIAGGLGICVGYHRLLTHYSFSTSRGMRWLFALLGTLSLQGSPRIWAARHRLHHRDSDGDGDPHSPRHGFWWAHVGWVFVKENYDASAAADLADDPVMRWLDRWHFVPPSLLGVVLLVAGWAAGDGVSWLIWGGFVRTALVLHFTWLVNSATHVWGYRGYQTRDDSRNNWWVALLTFGEGWHNNHHAHPKAASHGRRWWELDLAALAIRALALTGLVWNVVGAPDRAPARGRAAEAVRARPRTARRLDSGRHVDISGS